MSNFPRVWVSPFSSKSSFEEKVFFLLRFGVLGCFVGHGLWGIITKAGWVPFFEIFFIQPDTAYQLMPWVGAMDILIGLFCFFLPNRLFLVWAAFWTIFTALLRPSAGMGMSEFFERAGNYGVPIAFLYLYGCPESRRDWLTTLTSSFTLSAKKLHGFELLLRLGLVSLLIGHGGLTIFKFSQGIQNHLAYIGLDLTSSQLQIFGLLEVLLGILVMIKPRMSGLLVFILFWKLSTELLFPFAGKAIDLLETVERMGDYVIPVLLLIVYKKQEEIRRDI
jgi:hypothetical protein